MELKDFVEIIDWRLTTLEYCLPSDARQLYVKLLREGKNTLTCSPQGLERAEQLIQGLERISNQAS